MQFLSPLIPPSLLQSCIDWNRDILKQELGLSPKDIIDIPQLFNMKDKQAEAYFPDMVRKPRAGVSFEDWPLKEKKKD